MNPLKNNNVLENNVLKNNVLKTDVLNHSKYDTLETDILHLQESMNILHELVRDQQLPLDEMEEFIKESKQEVIKANQELVETKQIVTETRYWIYISSISTIAMVIAYFI